jgi:hypothetical protein
LAKYELVRRLDQFASSASSQTSIACYEVVQKFRYGLDTSNQQMVPGAGAGDIEQVTLGVIDLL